jgi:hypothetical protein
MWRQRQAEMNGQGQGPSGYFSADAFPQNIAHNIAKNMAEHVAGKFTGNSSTLTLLVVTLLFSSPPSSLSYMSHPQIPNLLSFTPLIKSLLPSLMYISPLEHLFPPLCRQHGLQFNQQYGRRMQFDCRHHP